MKPKTRSTTSRQLWNKRDFTSLIRYFHQVPSVQPGVTFGTLDDGCWWLKFGIDITHHLAWHVVQELGHVLNYISLEERLPTVFMPVSPPPYMNGGPEDYLSWVIESRVNVFRPSDCRKWLHARLPRPVNDLSQWQYGDD
jgi:hypothetical protein